MVTWGGLIWLRIGNVACACECGDELVTVSALKKYNKLQTIKYNTSTFLDTVVPSAESLLEQRNTVPTR